MTVAESYPNHRKQYPWPKNKEREGITKINTLFLLQTGSKECLPVKKKQFKIKRVNILYAICIVIVAPLRHCNLIIESQLVAG